MKKSLLVLLIALIGKFASAQKIFEQTKVQNEAEVIRMDVWDIPRSDSLTYKGIIPDNMHVIVGFSSNGSAMFALAPDTVFNDVVRWFKDTAFLSLSKTRIAGFEFVVANIESFSWFNRKKLKSFKGMQKAVAEAFNESKKYTLMAQSPRLVFGKRNSNGNIVPNFISSLDENPAPQKVKDNAPNPIPKVSTDDKPIIWNN